MTRTAPATGDLGRARAQGLRRDGRGRRRLLLRSPRGSGARAARRERRRQIDDRQAAVRADAAGLRASSRLFGEAARLSSPRDAQARGIQTAFQEMTLVSDLTVLDNMLLPDGPSVPPA